MLSDRFVFLVGVLFKEGYHGPASLADIGMATWKNIFISSVAFGFKDGRNVFCFRNVTTGCIGAFKRINCVMKLSVAKPDTVFLN